MKVLFGQQTTKVKQLSDQISQDISIGKYKEDDILPSINQLSHDYQVSRDTVFKAFLNLKELGIIDSTPGKGYFVVNRQKNVLLLLDEYSPFKETFYNSFVDNLSSHYKVDLWFHQYNERLFNTILRESIGRYNRYVVMNFDNEKFSSNLYKMDTSRLLLLDFGKFDKKNYSYICQDFDEAFYNALSQLSDKFHAYREIVMYFARTSKHPHSTCEYFLRFCDKEEMPCEIRDCTNITVEKGSVYIVIRQQDVVNIIKKSRALGLKCGRDFGLIAYNDTPAYEVIDEGITSLTIDWKKMGKMAAEFILTGNPIQTYLPTEVRLRKSL